MTGREVSGNEHSRKSRLGEPEVQGTQDDARRLTSVAQVLSGAHLPLEDLCITLDCSQLLREQRPPRRSGLTAGVQGCLCLLRWVPFLP